MITRCVCADVSFQHILDMMKTNGWTLSFTMKETRAGQGCGMCIPYLKLMDKTGCVSFRPSDNNARIVEPERKTK